MQKPFPFPILIITVLIVAGLSAIITTVVTNATIDRYINEIAADYQLVDISRERQRPLPGSYEQALELVQQQSLPAVAGLLVDGSGVADQKWWQPTSFDALGAVITGDGWVAFHVESIPAAFEVNDVSEVWIGQSHYAVENVVRDEIHQLVLIKIPAADLKVVTFGLSDSVTGGEYVFGTEDILAVDVGSLQNPFFDVEEGVALPAERYRYDWIIDGAFKGPVFNTAGELVALAGLESANPLVQQVDVIQSMLRNGEYVSVELGASVVPVVEIDGNRMGEQIVGEVSGAAEVAGLEVGDVIVAIDDLPVSRLKTVAMMLKDYSEGRSADITVMRGGEVKEFEVTF